jgi:predicted acylesterase/phospholipase RssA
MQGQQTTHRQFGLALSGGGFRAALYHLGVVRFLRDVQLLPAISRITSVSGGSIIGAHMVLNWDRYSGTDEAFQEVSEELIRLVRVDVRNRILRRFPLLAVANGLHRLTLLGTVRQYTRAGLLERHYEEFLYGDRALLELPESPHLYMLATNLSEGSLCAFCREGLILQRRSGAAGCMDIQTVQMGLATVPMAVAASSAFPGFFPPLELASKDVGASEGEFPRHAFTDGGIYDNLGLRMFRYLHGLDSVEDETQTDQSIMPYRLDGVFVSDAGATFKVRSDSRAGGVLRTALRSTDILMDRVNQLELEAFANTPGAVFFPITRVVEAVQDPTAMHPEIQKQVALIRTDLDRFSHLEISTLIQHGYCVARQALRETPNLVDTDIPAGPPWDPLASRDRNEGSPPPSLSDLSAVLPVARRLQRSSVRRFLSTLLSARDWPTYVWLPLIALTLLAAPTTLYKARKTAFQQQQVLSAIAKSSPLYGDVLGMLQSNRPYRIAPIEFEQVDSVEALDFTGYDVISDDRIYDLRGWTSSDRPQYAARMHARFQVLRTKQAEQRPVLRIQLPSDQETMQVEYLPEALKPRHVRTTTENGLYLYQTVLDFSHVPVGTETTLVVRQVLPANMATQEFGSGRFRFTIAARTGLARIWVLLPRGRPHDQFGLYRFPIGQPDKMEIVHATTSVEVPTGSIATFELINPPDGYRYECRWRWLDEDAAESGRVR